MHQALTDLPAMASEGQQRRSLRLVPSTLRCDSLDTSTTSTPAARSSRSTPAIQSSRSTPGEGCSCKTPQESAEIDEEPTSSKRIGLRRKREEPREPDGDPMGAAMKPLTDEERRSWPGWVELESEPVSSLSFLSLLIYTVPRRKLIGMLRHSSITFYESTASKM